MNRKTSIILPLLLLLFAQFSGQRGIETSAARIPDSRAGQATDSSQVVFRSVENRAWGIGERLTFTIRYGPVIAGTATMSVKDTVRIKNKLCYHIVTEAKSNRFIDKFYKVRDRAESFIDYYGLFSWRFEKHLREGKHKADKRTDYDHANNIAIAGEDTVEVPLFVQDVLSTFYFLRTQNYEVGEVLSVRNHSDRKVYDLKVRIHGKESVRLRTGTFKCVLVEPFLVEGGGVFKHEGRILVWITDDERRIPVQMKSKVYIGSVTAELEEMKGIL